MSKESEALMKEFHSMIDNTVNDWVDTFLLKRTISTSFLELTDDELDVLEAMPLTSDQVDVLHKGMMALGKLIGFGFLAIVDGVYVGKYEVPDLAIVDRSTNKDIADLFWHDEFVEVLNQMP